MEKTHSGLEIVKKDYCKNMRVLVSLTRKTTKNGEIKHGVVITNPRSGARTRLRTFDGIGGAWNLYKTILNA